MTVTTCSGPGTATVISLYLMCAVAVTAHPHGAREPPEAAPCACLSWRTCMAA